MHNGGLIGYRADPEIGYGPSRHMVDAVHATDAGHIFAQVLYLPRTFQRARRVHKVRELYWGRWGQVVATGRFGSLDHWDQEPG